MKNIFEQLVLFIFLLSSSAFASVPHDADKYAFHIDLPDGFTKLVTEEVPSRRVYGSYYGSYKDKKFVRVYYSKGSRF